MIAAILAAGRSTRMGKDKLLLPLGDRPVLAHGVDSVAAVQPQEILVIANRENEAVIAAAIGGGPGRIVVNARADEGMGTSIACAAASLPNECDSLLLLQGDQPLVSGEALARLVERFRAEQTAFVAARYGELVTTPVIFARNLFPELRALEGDRGARSVLDRHREEGELVDFPSWMALDVDDPDGYRRVVEHWRRQR